MDQPEFFAEIENSLPCHLDEVKTCARLQRGGGAFFAARSSMRRKIKSGDPLPPPDSAIVMRPRAANQLQYGIAKLGRRRDRKSHALQPGPLTTGDSS